MKIIEATRKNILKASNIIRAGGLVVFPTETVYGLGANALLAESVARIFEVKQRPFFDPLIVHLGSFDQVDQFVKTDNMFLPRLANNFWPGPLTLVLKKSNLIPSIVSSGLDSLAIRIPKNPVALELLKLSGCPIAAPSANPFGYLSSTSALQVKKAFDMVEKNSINSLSTKDIFILDGGPSQFGIESTVLDLSTAVPKILRPGYITKEEIEKVIETKINIEQLPKANSPGLLENHYAPKTKLFLANRGRLAQLLDEEKKINKNKKVAILAFDKSTFDSIKTSFFDIKILTNMGILTEAAANLFTCLHELDTVLADKIYAELSCENGLGIAIDDRLKKASFK